MKNKIIFFVFFAHFILLSCVSNQLTNIQKSARYNLDDYEILINPIKGLCINSDLTETKDNSLILIITDCISIQNTNQFSRRPVSSIITVNFLAKPGLSSFSTISDFIEKTDGELNTILNNTGAKIIKSYQKDNTLFLSVRNNNPILNTGNKLWKTLSIYDNVLVSTTAYGFSKKTSNQSSYNELEKKLKIVINSIKIKKLNDNPPV